MDVSVRTLAGQECQLRLEGAFQSSLSLSKEVFCQVMVILIFSFIVLFLYLYNNYLCLNLIHLSFMYLTIFPLSLSLSLKKNTCVCDARSLLPYGQ